MGIRRSELEFPTLSTDARQRAVFFAGVVSASLYLLMVFAAGFLLGDRVAWRAAILTMGLNYLVYVTQIAGWTVVPQALIAASIFCGTAAGVRLLLLL